MASDVAICNRALGILGQQRQVTSIDPPDGSVEAGRCATFYPTARLELIEAHNWPFAMARVELAPVAENPTAWAGAYALPADCLRAVRVPTAYTASLFDQPGEYRAGLFVPRGASSQRPGEASAPFELEGGILYTDEPTPTLIYLRDVTDSTKFTPGFTTALQHLLASYLAGPIIKGLEGARVAERWRLAAERLAVQGLARDAASAGQSQSSGTHIPAHLANR